MKNPLSDLYEQVLLNEAEKHALQNPSQDEVGNLKPKQDLFGTKPKVVEGPEKAKVQKGPAYEETTGSASKPAATKSSMPHSAPAKETKVEKGEEMKDTKVNPKKEDEEDKEKKEVKKESFTMSAFETLFKKTLNEELNEEPAPAVEDIATEDEPLELEDSSEEEGMDEEEEGDLLADLKDLQDKLASILSKLEDSAEEAEEAIEDESAEYTEDDFDKEFGEDEEEAPVKESVDKPKHLSDSKGKVLMSKKNKVGKVHPKGGKAHTGTIKDDAEPKALGDKKAHLQKGKPEVKSTVKKGDFIK